MCILCSPSAILNYQLLVPTAASQTMAWEMIVSYLSSMWRLQKVGHFSHYCQNGEEVGSIYNKLALSSSTLND